MQYDRVQLVYLKEFLRNIGELNWTIIQDKMQETLNCDLKDIEWTCQPLSPSLVYEGAFVVITATNTNIINTDPLFGTPINV